MIGDVSLAWPSFRCIRVDDATTKDGSTQRETTCQKGVSALIYPKDYYASTRTFPENRYLIG